MSWLGMLTLTVAALSALECVTGRLAAMHWREHRQTWVLGYLLAAGVCILAASLVWQRLDVRWLDWAAWCIAAHLALSWREWRNGPPSSVRRDARHYPAGAAASNVPHVLSGEVVGLDGTKVWPVVAEPADRCVLWVVAGDMAGAQLDLAGVESLQAVLAEVAQVMRAAAKKAAAC